MIDIRLLYITPDFPSALEDIRAFEARHDIHRDRGLQPIAHTLPENKASVHVLERLGFVNVGTVIADPEDGPVWR